MFSLACHNKNNNFYLFLEQLSDAVVYLSRDYEILYCNPATGKLLDQQSLDLLVGLCKDYQEHVSISGSWTHTFDFLVNNGNHLVLKIHITVAQAGDCYPAGLIITCKEVSGVANTAHLQLRPYFEAFIQHLPALAWITDEQFILHYYNEEFKRSFQLSENSIGSSFEQLYPFLQFTEYKKNHKKVFSSNTLLETIEEGIDGKGEKCVYKVYRFPISSIGNKKLLGAIALNITSQMKQQQELAAFKERFRYVEEAKKKEIIKAIIEAQEKERTQISYELHEQLSQNLATCKLLLDGLHFPETKEEERIRLRSSMKLLTQTMNEIRSMSHQLNANAIKMVGLVGVMRDLTSTVNQNWQVEVLLQCNGFSDTTVLPKDIEVSAFRIFQEGMNNVIRHSGATHATVQLTKKHKWLILSIKDNGKGFDTAITSKGLGFTNIINRVDYHNGTVSINSSEGNGCTLEVRLPVVEKSSEG